MDSTRPTGKWKIVITCEPIPDDLGGGWHACVVGMEYYLIGDGETLGEAVEDLGRWMRDEEKRREKL